MDVYWLRDFIELAQQRNFSRAAEERNVSQPAFSRRIRALEAEVGVPLVNRETLPLTLTRAGEVFLAQADIILATYDDALERCRSIAARDDESIRFATTHSLYLTHYQRHIAPLVQREGFETDLNSTSWSADQFVTALQQGYCDVILTYWHPQMEYLSPLQAAGGDYLTISTDRLIPVARRSPETGQTAIRLDDTKGPPIPILAYGLGSALRPVVDHILNQISQVPQFLQVNQNVLASSIKEMAIAGFGMGWVPQELCRVELQDGRLSQIGDARYAADLEVRLYRYASNHKPMVKKLWDALRRRGL